jgi:hypothetical protein
LMVAFMTEDVCLRFFLFVCSMIVIFVCVV